MRVMLWIPTLVCFVCAAIAASQSEKTEPNPSFRFIGTGEEKKLPTPEKAPPAQITFSTAANEMLKFDDTSSAWFEGGMVLERSGTKGDRVTFNDRTGKAIASVDLTDGTVTIHQAGKNPEAAKAFWKSIRVAQSLYLPPPVCLVSGCTSSELPVSTPPVCPK